jgi:competence protein ComEC
LTTNLLAILLVAVIVFFYNKYFVEPKAVVPPDARPKAHFIDVGQGDCILVTTEQFNMLIDSGEEEYADKVIEYIKRQGVERLDAVVATHPHSDHIGGLDKVIEYFQTVAVYMPEATNNTAQFEQLLQAIEDANLRVTVPIPGDTISKNGLEITFLAPESADETNGYSNLNNASIVMRANIGGKIFLFTGDAEIESEKAILASGASIVCDVLKVGHHGSSTSTGREFFEAAAPGTAVIMCGQGNRYGHPHVETVKLLEGAGVDIYRTDKSGTVVFIIDDGVMEVVTEV